MSELPQEEPGAKPRLQLEFIHHNGILMANSELDQIKKVNMREDDIFVCAFPRSGTTLTQELVYLVRTFDTANSVELDDRFPVIDVKDDRYPYYRGVKHFDQMLSPRMIKSHMHYDFLPDQLQNGKGRIIYVARNPKDVVTSFFNLLLWLDEVAREENKTWNSFFQAFIDGKGYGERSQKNCIISGKNLTEDDVSRICEHCSVENMRKHDKCNMAYWRDIKHINDKAPGRFINQGKAGVWKQKLTVEESEKMDVLISEVEKFGLTFDHTK